MKIKLLVFLLLSLNCFAENFIKEEFILKEFKALKNAKQMVEQLTISAKQRMKLLSRNKNFISEEQIIKLKKMKIKENDYINAIDRRNCDNKAVSQCGGTCTSHGVTNAIDNKICLPNKQNTSNQHLWSLYKKYDTWSAIKTASKYKICDEKHWPNCGRKKLFCNSNAHVKISKYKYLANSIIEAKRALEDGNPLVYSGQVTKSWANCDAVINPKSKATDGGHAVAIVGFKDSREVEGGGYFILLNSWGADCGNNGYQYLPYNYLTRKDLYGFFHEIREVKL